MTSRLEPGEQAPAFSLPDDAGSTVSLDDFAGRKVIVYFYPAAMTPGCTKQACDFSESLDSLKKDGYEVVGISKDKPAKLAKFRERDHLTIPLLSDEDLSVHHAYGAWGEKTLYGKKSVGVIRSTFLVAGNGRIARAWYHVRADGHAAKVLEEAATLG